MRLKALNDSENERFSTMKRRTRVSDLLVTSAKRKNKQREWNEMKIFLSHFHDHDKNENNKNPLKKIESCF